MSKKYKSPAVQKNKFYFCFQIADQVSIHHRPVLEQGLLPGCPVLPGGPDVGYLHSAPAVHIPDRASHHTG